MISKDLINEGPLPYAGWWEEDALPMHVNALVIVSSPCPPEHLQSLALVDKIISQPTESESDYDARDYSFSM